MAAAAAIGRGEDLVLQGAVACSPAALPADHQRARRARSGDRAVGPETSHRLEDHVDQLQIGLLIARHRRRRRRVGDGARRIADAHHVAHAVVELHLRCQRANERIEDAGLHHRGTQIDRSLGLRAGVGEIERDAALGDGDGDGELHRLVELDAVIVHEALGRRAAFRERADRGGKGTRRAVEDRGEGIHQRAGAETLAQLGHAPGAQFGRRNLGADVAAHQVGLAAVGEDEALQILVIAPGMGDLHGRQQQPLVEHLGRVGRGAAGIGAADIRLVRDRAAEPDQPSGSEDGRDEAHVRDMRHAGLVGVVRDEHVARRDRAFGIKRQDAADEMAIDGRVEEHRRRRDEAPAAVEDDAGEIARLADDGRIARAVEMIVHLVDQARDLVADHLDRHRVGRCALLPSHWSSARARGCGSGRPSRSSRAG